MTALAIKLVGSVLRFFDFRLYYRFCSFIVRKQKGKRVLSIFNFKIKFERSDPYWSRLICRQFKYEVEIENWLRSECSPKVFFIDCGANIGYWSVFVSKVIGVEDFVAIEPNPKIFRTLTENLRLNNIPEYAMEGAVGNMSIGKTTTDFYLDNNPGMHVGASIFEENVSNKDKIQVPLISLTKIFETAAKVDRDIILKLDVEGAEAQCINQIPKQIKNKVRIIYEDHGRDIECFTTKSLLATQEYKIYFLHPRGSIEIKTLANLATLKKSKNKGYNLVAIPA
jgi:FkbM family methyltransferase